MRPALHALQRFTDAILLLLFLVWVMLSPGMHTTDHVTVWSRVTYVFNDVGIPSCRIQTVCQVALFTSLQRVSIAACVDKPV